jgi:hypothetical protein
VLSRANLVTFNNGDAMLSSAQMHQVGSLSFQKQPWMASLGCDACVWTTARWLRPTGGESLKQMCAVDAGRSPSRQLQPSAALPGQSAPWSTLAASSP